MTGHKIKFGLVHIIMSTASGPNFVYLKAIKSYGIWNNVSLFIIVQKQDKRDLSDLLNIRILTCVNAMIKHKDIYYYIEKITSNKTLVDE